ncbi:type VI secretion system protein ImpJ [Pseudomonas sp. SJZ079]|uniref:type VI secretion system baseplate subunit TssK n=1 Tax=Pseudomonas sp. SJZ079 TaxID=2572887 RepID=UPI00119A4865|nr:type VI secretion system baseplate subunit TssK [Pseudomonas sp. SJZ079]TWC40131.1 type VI secretion system protein ImpJ [Pseudomonas sp. SJZ079]
MSGIPDAICWHEGMHLLPQHFQLQGLRAETLSARQASAAQPWFWGSDLLEVDEAALSNGKVRISALDAILPDGLPVGFDATSRSALELDVVEAIDASPQGMTTVYLAVAPLYRGGQLAPLGGRYVSMQGEPVPDLASGQFPEPISVWRADLRLVSENNKADSICLPLLRIGKQGGGYARIAYVAPTSRVRPESALGHKVAALCARTREKCVFLSGRLRQAHQAANAEDAAEIGRLLAALWARLPEVEAALASRVAHPATLHGLLNGMAGSLCALNPLAGVPAFKPLVYEELLAGYEELLDWLNATLDLVRAGYRSLTFARDKQGFWIDLPACEELWQRLVIGLRMPAGVGERAAGQWLESAIVASETHIATLARQRMHGMPQQPLSRTEQITYSVGEDTRLFALQAEREWFDPRQRLRILVPGGGAGVEPWEVVLFVAEPNGNSGE